ncbi:hypothetical protein [Aurantiacibacter gangjinensis]|uniref:hypothetical protein n=1 Tax=Aurantiacibacter gangjinensis TaxID=502682 RepID=UPI00090C606B|nr:hypothetical protein [Aurantiacibacter gangjinensis]APE28773.1 hypothetical protein BMF35_a1944 [Aurantiacibacter gangjinensis]
MEYELVEGRDIHQPVAGRENGYGGFPSLGQGAQADEPNTRRRAMHIPEQAY